MYTKLVCVGRYNFGKIGKIIGGKISLQRSAVHMKISSFNWNIFDILTVIFKFRG